MAILTVYVLIYWLGEQAIIIILKNIDFIIILKNIDYHGMIVYRICNKINETKTNYSPEL